MSQPKWDDNKKGLTIASQMKPIVCRVDILRFVLFWLLTKPRRISIKSGHCPWGNSTAAIAETTVEAKVPAFWLVDPRVMRESCLIFVLVSLLRESHLWMLSVCRKLSYDRSMWVKKRPKKGRNNWSTYTSRQGVFECKTGGITHMQRRALVT